MNVGVDKGSGVPIYEQISSQVEELVRDGLLPPGTKIVGDLLVAAEGYIRSVASATVAEVAVARGQITDASTTTAVEVIL